MCSDDFCILCSMYCDTPSPIPNKIPELTVFVVSKYFLNSELFRFRRKYFIFVMDFVCFNFFFLDQNKDFIRLDTKRTSLSSHLFIHIFLLLSVSVTCASKQWFYLSWNCKTLNICKNKEPMVSNCMGNLTTHSLHLSIFLWHYPIKIQNEIPLRLNLWKSCI